MMLTYYQVLNQTAGQPAVKSIEALREIRFGATGPKYKREVDIVLDIEGKERFVELKSMRAPLTDSLFRRWTFRSKVGHGEHLHKEFFSDVVQANDTKRDILVDMSWRFHSFVSKDKRTRGPKSSDMRWVKNRLCKMPNSLGADGASWLEDLTGKKPGALERDCNSGSDVQVQHARAVVNDFIRNGLFGDVGELLEDLLQDLAAE
ncbi:hypothetical protein RNAN_2535 [Rheinheimera nanhaiensis E407-8]|uniref:Uncharacterized protein n=2 Tax=Rheinheimera TaxID=67575 RepID=I1DZQ1_9GAMM|nr:hypothetical protein RNAN_2535 [Rheinheimera nanhaiensis E407-8]